jgi:signal transduction histidine kinase
MDIAGNHQCQEGNMAIIPYKNRRISNLDTSKFGPMLSSYTNQPDLIAENKKLEAELHLSLEEIAHLQNALANAKMKLAAYHDSSAKDFTCSKQDLAILTNVIKEISIPLKTITDYCDLLTSQSVGILGSLQKKFVDRINGAAGQIHELLDDFQNNSLINELYPGNDAYGNDIHLVLEEILTANALLLREKQLVLQMEVPEDLPYILGEKEELHHVIEMILTNAIAITPKDGSMSITAMLENNLSAKKVILRVRDGGPGIPQNELKRLFPLQKYEGAIEIPGCSLKRAELMQLFEMSRSQGCLIKITNAIGFGCVFEILFCVHAD